MTAIHAITLTIYLLAVGAIASTWWRTRATWTWYAFAILAAPIAAVIWLLTLPTERAPSEQEEPRSDGPSGLTEDTDPRSPPPITLPHDHTTPEDRHVPPPPPPDDADRDAELDWYRERTDALRDD